MSVKIIGLLTLLMLASCKADIVQPATPTLQATQVPAFVSPLVSPLAWPSGYWGPVLRLGDKLFLTTLTSPGGRVKLLLLCSYNGMEAHCRALLPNGKTIYEADKSEWSPNERFAMVCEGSTHDSPCSRYEVWNMITGEKIDQLSRETTRQWSPNDDHTLVYLIDRGGSLGAHDQLVALDLETGEKKYLDSCPDWFRQDFQWACDNFPGIVIGGQLSGLPDDATVRVLIYWQDSGKLYSFDKWKGNAAWAANLRMSAGMTYTVTTQAEAYVASPISYTLQISGTSKAYVVVGGQMTTDEATHLDFHFVPAP